MASISITRSWTSGNSTASYKLTIPYTISSDNTKTTIELGSFSTTKTGSGAAAPLRDNAIIKGLTLSFNLTGEDGSNVKIWEVNTKNSVLEDSIGKTYSWTRAKTDYTKAIWVMMTGVTHVSGSVSIPKKPSYTITYTANGGSGTNTTQTKWYGESLTLKPANTYSRTDYSFYHWNTNNTNTGTSYNAGATYTGNAALTLNAIWNPIITYKANGGSGSDVTQTKTYGTNISLKPGNTYSKTGYSFYHWNTKADNTGTSYNANATYSANTSVTLYVIWNPIITYKPNGGSGSDITQTKTYGTDISFKPANTYSRTHYNFQHWNTKADGTGISKNAGATYTGNDSITLYAIWEQVYATPVLNLGAIYRSDQSKNPKDDGSYLVVEADWQIFQRTTNTTNNQATITVEYEEINSSPLVTGTLSKTFTQGTLQPSEDDNSGDSKKILFNHSFDANKSYNIRVTLQDKGNESDFSIKNIPTAFFPIDISQGGQGMALGGAAGNSGLDIYYNTNFYGNVNTDCVYTSKRNTTNPLKSGIMLAKSEDYENVPSESETSIWNGIHANSLDGLMNNYYRAQGYHAFYANGSPSLYIYSTQIDSRLPMLIRGNLTVNGTITSNNPPFKWKSVAETISTSAGNSTVTLSTSFAAISGYSRRVADFQTNSSNVIVAGAYLDGNTVKLRVRNFSSGALNVTYYILYLHLNDSLKWT